MFVKAECNTAVKSAFGLWSKFSGGIGVFCHVFRRLVVANVLAVLVFPGCYIWLSFDGFLEVLAIIVLDVVNLSTVALFFSRISTVRSSRLMILISRLRILQSVIRKHFFRGLSFRSLPPSCSWLGGTALLSAEISLNFPQGKFLPHVNLRLQLIWFLIHVVVDSTLSTDEQKQNGVGDYLYLLNLFVKKQH